MEDCTRFVMLFQELYQVLILPVAKEAVLSFTACTELVCYFVSLQISCTTFSKDCTEFLYYLLDTCAEEQRGANLPFKNNNTTSGNIDRMKTSPIVYACSSLCASLK